MIRIRPKHRCLACGLQKGNCLAIPSDTGDALDRC
jgi:hypothetical protein